MSAVTAFIKVCHGFVYAKGESSIEQTRRSLRGKLNEVARSVSKGWHKEGPSVLCEGQ